MIRFLYVFVLFCYAGVQAQQLLPFVENFTKSAYSGDNQVWNVVQGNDNAIYFANNHFFLRYNGVKWEKYTLPNKTIIRSVFADGDRVYCGSYKEFGYWKRIKGKMQYFSISKSHNLFTGSAENEEIWKIFKHKGKLYFQSFNEIYVLEGKAIKRLKFPSQVSYCYIVDGSIYVASVRNGIYKLLDDTFELVNAWQPIKNNIVHGIAMHDKAVYIFTKQNGIYLSNDDGLNAWTHALNTQLKEDLITTATFLENDMLAIGTVMKGIYILDLKTGTYKNINRKNSLKNNAVLSLTVDKEKDLWLGLDNGIAHIEINAPVSLLTDSSGLLGSVYSLSTLDDGYLLVTNHGIFTYADNAFKPVPNSSGQVWDIYKADNKFIIGHNDGTLVYNGNEIVKANPVNGGWKFLKSIYDGVYFQANYTGVAVYKDINNLTDWKMLKGLTKPIKNIAQNKAGELWAADNYKSLYRITYDNNFEVKKIENISATNNIKSDFGVKIFNFRNEIYFFINNKWYNYNSISGKLEVNTLFNASFNAISDIIPIDDTRFMVIKSGLLYIVNQVDNNFEWKLIPEKYYEGRLILENTQVHTAGIELMVNLDDGFMAFTTTTTKAKPGNIVIEAYYNNELVDDDTNIKFNQPVNLNIISQYYGYNHPYLFYKLNGSKEFIAVKSGYITLNNLSSGSQEVEVYYNNGTKFIKLSSYTFTVSKPWYFSYWMIMFYVLATASIFLLYYRWNHLKYLQKVRLNEEELKHRTQIISLEHEAEIKLRQQEYEKHRLEMEVQSKASEVAGKSLSIAKHSEMIENIQVVLESEKNSEQLVTKIRKIIKTSSISKNEWQNFEKNLIKSHEEFVVRLSKKYPHLTPKDIKLCIYLKMNLSSKEIAPLMNISFRGVELHRYRLRKKLEITPEESLSKIMINL